MKTTKACVRDFLKSFQLFFSFLNRSGVRFYADRKVIPEYYTAQSTGQTRGKGAIEW